MHITHKRDRTLRCALPSPQNREQQTVNSQAGECRHCTAGLRERQDSKTRSCLGPCIETAAPEFTTAESVPQGFFVTTGQYPARIPASVALLAVSRAWQNLSRIASRNELRRALPAYFASARCWKTHWKNNAEKTLDGVRSVLGKMYCSLAPRSYPAPFRSMVPFEFTTFRPTSTVPSLVLDFSFREI